MLQQPAAQQPQPVASGPPGQLSGFTDIPASMIGKLIGRGGDTIKQLQFSSGTRIQIDHDSGVEHKRVNITGPTPESVEKAKNDIDLLVQDDGAEHSESVECPQGIVGRIIGVSALQLARLSSCVLPRAGQSCRCSPMSGLLLLLAGCQSPAAGLCNQATLDVSKPAS